MLREKHRLRISQSKVPRTIFGPKRDDVTRDWWKLHEEEYMTGTPNQALSG
jgi:hypothetical protein